jgi:hypothetical protein
VLALRRPEGRPGGTDAAAGRAPRHRRRRAPLAPPGPGGDLRVDAQQGRHDRPRRRSGALDRSRRILPPRHERPVARPPRRRRPRPVRRACGRSRPTASSSGCIASRSTEIPVLRYAAVIKAVGALFQCHVRPVPAAGATVGLRPKQRGIVLRHKERRRNEFRSICHSD